MPWPQLQKTVAQQKTAPEQMPGAAENFLTYEKILKPVSV